MKAADRNAEACRERDEIPASEPTTSSLLDYAEHTFITPIPVGLLSEDSQHVGRYFIEPVPPKAHASHQPTQSHQHYDEHTAVATCSNPHKKSRNFPVERTRAVQSQHYIYTRITDAFVHRDPSGIVSQVTADVTEGPIDLLLINDARLIYALGLYDGFQD